VGFDDFNTKKKFFTNTTKKTDLQFPDNRQNPTSGVGSRVWFAWWRMLVGVMQWSVNQRCVLFATPLLDEWSMFCGQWPAD
jgi:hypothetical protein